MCRRRLLPFRFGFVVLEGAVRVWCFVFFAFVLCVKGAYIEHYQEYMYPPEE